jgi:hypothetical protein
MSVTITLDDNLPERISDYDHLVYAYWQCHALKQDAKTVINPCVDSTRCRTDRPVSFEPTQIARSASHDDRVVQQARSLCKRGSRRIPSLSSRLS